MDRIRSGLLGERGLGFIEWRNGQDVLSHRRCCQGHSTEWGRRRLRSTGFQRGPKGLRAPSQQL